jgi:hypothetical protein
MNDEADDKPGASPMTPTTATVPVYEGRLDVELDREGRPLLYLSFRCGACKRQHHHRWGLAEDGAEDFAPHHRRPHCTRRGAHPLGYFISPLPSPANRATFARYARILAEHQAGAPDGAAAGAAPAGAGAGLAAG